MVGNYTRPNNPVGYNWIDCLINPKKRGFLSPFVIIISGINLKEIAAWKSAQSNK
jgi:hypothetical protein